MLGNDERRRIRKKIKETGIQSLSPKEREIYSKWLVDPKK